MRKAKVACLILGVLGLIVFYQNCAKEIDLDQYMNNSSGSSAPVVSSSQEVLSLNVGDVATLTFMVTGSNLKFSWYKDNVLMENVGQTTIYQISNVQTSHSGVYRLCVENKYGSSCAETQLVVNAMDPGPTPVPTTPTPTPSPGVTCNCYQLMCTGDGMWYPISAPITFEAPSYEECVASGNIPPTQLYCTISEQGTMCGL